MDLDLLRSEPLRRLRRSEYDQLVDAGCFEDERVELLYGLLVEMSPQGVAHAFAIQTLTAHLVVALQGRAHVRPQLPLALGDDSEPEPDVAVVPLDAGRRTHPATAHLVVEVADSSARRDRAIKSRLYAEAAIPEYWIVDVDARRVERYLAPENGRYTTMTTHAPGERLALAAFPDVSVALAELLPA